MKLPGSKQGKEEGSFRPGTSQRLIRGQLTPGLWLPCRLTARTVGAFWWMEETNHTSPAKKLECFQLDRVQK